MAAESLLDRLTSLAHAEGGWGYAPGQTPQLEPTCFGLLALAAVPERHGEVREKALGFLDRCARSDGSYRQPNGRPEAIWPTSLVLFTRSVLGSGQEGLDRTAAFLVGQQSRVPDNPEAGELHDIDLKLTGWPWAESNFSWVEPTSWACLALRRLGWYEHPRVREGQAMLLDRAMDEGGINYGNRRILGRMTEPIPGPTALMLLALQGSKEARLAAAVRYLCGQVERADVEHLAWIKIALDVHRDQPGVDGVLAGLDDRLDAAMRRRDETPWLRPAVLRTALACLAANLSEGNPFRLDGSTTRGDTVPQAAAPASNKVPWTARFGAWFRGLAIKAAGQLRPLPADSGVHIARAPDYDADLVGVLQTQFERFRPQVPLKDKRVVLKPNLVEYHRDKVINTDPRVVAAVIELCKREGAREIVVAEGPGHWRNVEFLVRESGLGEVLEKAGVPFVDINHDEPVRTPNLGRLTGLEYLYLSRTIASAEVLVSLPKLKTHHWAGATLSLKNLFGTLPGISYGWPKNELHWRGIDNSIVDIALTRPPDLAIVDGIVGMEGDGPLNGTAKPFGALIMGHDLVAVDATCCRLMGLDPEKIGYLVLGNMKKLGRLKENEIPQIGESIASLQQSFETVRHHEVLRLKVPA